MQKSVFSAIIIGLLISIMPLNAQKANNEVGLKVDNIRPKTATFTSAKSTKTLTPQLNLPKINDPSLLIRQNPFYAQHRYPQFYSHYNPRNYYLEVDAQKFFTENPRDLFAERVIEVAIAKLFNLD